MEEGGYRCPSKPPIPALWSVLPPGLYQAVCRRSRTNMFINPFNKYIFSLYPGDKTVSKTKIIPFPQVLKITWQRHQLITQPHKPYITNCDEHFERQAPGLHESKSHGGFQKDAQRGCFGKELVPEEGGRKASLQAGSTVGKGPDAGSSRTGTRTNARQRDWSGVQGRVAQMWLQKEACQTKHCWPP